jgi:ATP-dependent Clp protease adaptor protein ClpS
MDEVITNSNTKDETKVERPRLHKVILVNDDYTPREFVVTVLKAVFRMNEDQALRVMITAHRRGTCVVAVYTKAWQKLKQRMRRMLAEARAIRCCSRQSRRNSAGAVPMSLED